MLYCREKLLRNPVSFKVFKHPTIYETFRPRFSATRGRTVSDEAWRCPFWKISFQDVIEKSGFI